MLEDQQEKSKQCQWGSIHRYFNSWNVCNTTWNVWDLYCPKIFDKSFVWNSDSGIGTLVWHYLPMEINLRVHRDYRLRIIPLSKGKSIISNTLAVFCLIPSYIVKSYIKYLTIITFRMVIESFTLYKFEISLRRILTFKNTFLKHTLFYFSIAQSHQTTFWHSLDNTFTFSSDKSIRHNYCRTNA